MGLETTMKPFRVGDVVKRVLVEKNLAIFGSEKTFTVAEHMLVLSVTSHYQANWFTYEMLIIWINPRAPLLGASLHSKHRVSLPLAETPGTRSDAYVLLSSVDSGSDSNDLQETSESP